VVVDGDFRGMLSGVAAAPGKPVKEEKAVEYSKNCKVARITFVKENIL